MHNLHNSLVLGNFKRTRSDVSTRPTIPALSCTFSAGSWLGDKAVDSNCGISDMTRFIVLRASYTKDDEWTRPGARRGCLNGNALFSAPREVVVWRSELRTSDDLESARSQRSLGSPRLILKFPRSSDRRFFGAVVILKICVIREPAYLPSLPVVFACGCIFRCGSLQ
jgi:hypothetical protein